jgi:hypothetical protein
MRERKLGGHVMARRDWARQRSWTKPMRIVLIKRVPDYSMLSQRPRIYSFMVPMCLMLLPRLPPPNRDSIFTLTGRSGNSGATTRNNLQFLTETLSLSYQQCKATRNPLGYGRNMPTPSCVSVASLLLFMNLVFTPAWSMVIE